MLIVVNVDSTNVSFDGVNYPKMFYAKPIHNNEVEIRSQETNKLFQKKLFSQIKVGTTVYENSTLTVNALNAILTPTLA